MADKIDRRIRKTRAQLRAGLARLMQKKNIHEITVKELVDEVDINRSTFYLHYEDIYQMLESIEHEIMEEIRKTITTEPIEPITSTEKAQKFLVHIFSYLEENRDICNALLGPHGDMAFVEQTEKLAAETLFETLINQIPEPTAELTYTYSFCLTGLVGLLKNWLSSDNPESPQYMANLTHRIFSNVTKEIMPSA